MQKSWKRAVSTDQVFAEFSIYNLNSSVLGELNAQPDDDDFLHYTPSNFGKSLFSAGFGEESEKVGKCRNVIHCIIQCLLRNLTLSLIVDKCERCEISRILA